MGLIKHDPKRLYGYEIRPEGVFVKGPDELHIRLGMGNDLAAHPTGDLDAPALPFRFTLRQFLAFEQVAGVVAQMSEIEIEELRDKSPMSHGLVMAVQTATPAPVVAEIVPTEARQNRRLLDCEKAGLDFKAYKGRLPDGVGRVAEAEGVTRQAFSADVKAALMRRELVKREGVTVRQR